MGFVVVVALIMNPQTIFVCILLFIVIFFYFTVHLDRIELHWWRIAHQMCMGKYIYTHMFDP